MGKVHLKEDLELIKKETSDTISVNKETFQIVKKALININESLSNIIDLLRSEDDLKTVSKDLKVTLDRLQEASAPVSYGTVLEGVFDGVKMIASDGQDYEVPQNYASKSKLIEGDILKLTIAKNGSYIYKQISPVERRRIVGTLGIDEASGNYYVMGEGHAYKVIPASVTYYKGEVGDEVIMLVPKDGVSAWCAIENVIKK